MSGVNSPELGRQRPDKAEGFEGDSDDLADEPGSVLGIFGAVRVGSNAGHGVGVDLVLVDDPLEGGAVVRDRDASRGTWACAMTWR